MKCVLIYTVCPFFDGLFLHILDVGHFSPSLVLVFHHTEMLNFDVVKGVQHYSFLGLWVSCLVFLP